MKISRIKHVLITSIIFLIIIAIIVAVYNSMLNAVKQNTDEMVYRIVAKDDIDPGEPITLDNVERQSMQNTLKMDGMIYRLTRSDNYVQLVEEAEKGNKIAEDDGLWAVGKIAKEKIYKGEILINQKLTLTENATGEETRLYAIPFSSSTTGGYNIKLGEKVDICVLYADSQKSTAAYQNLPNNKAIDIVLAEKQIADIRDESGNSRKEQGINVVPGYLCFNLSYEEINTIEIAKRQGTLFIGTAENYYKTGSQASTFMTGASMPVFSTEKGSL